MSALFRHTIYSYSSACSSTRGTEAQPAGPARYPSLWDFSRKCDGKKPVTYKISCLYIFGYGSRYFRAFRLG